MADHALRLVLAALFLAALVWCVRRVDPRTLSATLDEPPSPPAWEERLEGDGDHFYGRAHSFNAPLADADARARAVDFAARD